MYGGGNYDEVRRPDPTRRERLIEEHTYDDDIDPAIILESMSLAENNIKYLQKEKRLEQLKRESDAREHERQQEKRIIELNKEKAKSVREGEIRELLTKVKRICGFDKSEYCDEILSQLDEYIQTGQLIDREIYDLIEKELGVRVNKIANLMNIFSEYYLDEIQDDYCDEYIYEN